MGLSLSERCIFHISTVVHSWDHRRWNSSQVPSTVNDLVPESWSRHENFAMTSPNISLRRCSSPVRRSSATEYRATPSRYSGANDAAEDRSPRFLPQEERYKSVETCVPPGPHQTWRAAGADRGTRAAGRGAALVTPTSLALIRQEFTDAAARTRAIAYWAMGGSVAAAAGPILGGALAELDWRWIFYLNLPVGLLALLVLAFVSGSPRLVVPFDVTGQVSAVLALAAFTFAVIQGADLGYTSNPVLVAYVTSTVLCEPFVVMPTPSRRGGGAGAPARSVSSSIEDPGAPREARGRPSGRSPSGRYRVGRCTPPQISMTDADPGTTPYDVLGVDRHASAEELRRAYRRRQRETHPDLGAPGSIEAIDGARTSRSPSGRRTSPSSSSSARSPCSHCAPPAFQVTDSTNIPGPRRAGGAAGRGHRHAVGVHRHRWVVYMGNQGIPDQEEQWQAVHDADLANGQTWLPPAPMNNTYGFAMGPDAAAELGITS
ncbi:MFS transporter [Georgenia sp. SUBG003]|uniref:MFS transporter n=1 Tax=Georgenia sp. SUBG003 TaxID=1497974 RepID=UPI003AB29789